MSADREYTMYRRDSRGTIVVDLDSPALAILALLEKAKEDEAETQTRVNDYERLLKAQREILATRTQARERFEEAYNLVQEAINPGLLSRSDFDNL